MLGPPCRALGSRSQVVHVPEHPAAGLGLPNRALQHPVELFATAGRPLLERASPDDEKDKDGARHAERLLMQLHELDPTSEHCRYPIQKDGSDTLAKLNRVHIRRFHEAMESVAHFL